RGTVGAARDRDAALPALDRRSRPLEERALRAPRGPGAARARRAPPAQAHRMDGAGLTIVFRSRRWRECDERLLVLTAVGVEGFVAPAPDWREFLLQGEVARAELAGRHLAANLGAGVWFGYLAGRQMGVGTAWLLTVTGAALANLLEGLTGPPEHQAVGASTAVFAALGAMSAHSWRERLQLPQRWARRWGPLVAGVILLGWTGSAGEGTDLVAHVAGFAVGAALGALAALPVVRAALDRTPQWLTGAAALGSVAIAWSCALLE